MHMFQQSIKVSLIAVSVENMDFFSCFFLRIFVATFLVREDPILLSSVDEYCCTYREDVGNRLPLCEG